MQGHPGRERLINREPAGGGEVRGDGGGEVGLADFPTTRRDGEGFWYVLDGEIDMTVGPDHFVLKAGDSAHFDQRHPYRMANRSDQPVRILWVGTPALF
jgi:mannose-6-phosphate isomerase-like protein (cupin superfamily)